MDNIMALSDCFKCWNTPCTCGWNLRKRSLEFLEEQHRLISGAIQYKKAHPYAKFRTLGEEDTEDDIDFMNYISNVKGDRMSDETKNPANNSIDLARGNACALGDLTILGNPEDDREDWEPYKVKYAVLIEFASELDAISAINDRKCEFTILGG